MTLALYMHPFASFCQKVLVAFYEADVAFDPRIVDLGDAADRARFQALWPPAKMPVLVDEGEGVVVPESTVIIEYAAPGLIPTDPALAWRVRLWDRIFDNHVQHPMQKIVLDRLRPDGADDPAGVAQAQADLRVAYDLVEGQLTGRRWCLGDDFTLADCAAAPALWYADKVEPSGDRPALRAYLDRLIARPSFARVLAEAAPYAAFFPKAH